MWWGHRLISGAVPCRRFTCSLWFTWSSLLVASLYRARNWCVLLELAAFSCRRHQNLRWFQIMRYIVIKFVWYRQVVSSAQLSYCSSNIARIVDIVIVGESWLYRFWMGQRKMMMVITDFLKPEVCLRRNNRERDGGGVGKRQKRSEDSLTVCERIQMYWCVSE